MIVLFIGDPHLKISKFDISCKFLTWVGEVVDQVKPDLVINLGDTFDTHAVVRSEVLTKFKEHVKQITATTPYFYILGNHDMYKPNDSKYHALETFKDLPNFKVIDKIVHSTKMGMSFIPYIHDHNEFPLETQPICVAHQTFVGADYGYHRPDVGVDADKVSAEIIISGHIHKRQNFGKVFYPGTPFASGIDDINQIKGLMLFDTDTYNQELIQSPFPKWKGMRLELAQDFNIHDLSKTVQQTTNETDHWVVEISGPKAEVMAYIDSKEVAKLKESRSLRFKPEYNDKEKAMRVKIKSSSMGDIVNEYVDKVYQGALDKDVIKSKALEVLQKSRNS